MKNNLITILFIWIFLLCQAQKTEITYDHFFSEQFPTSGCTSCLFDQYGLPNKTKEFTYQTDTILAFSYDPSTVTYWSLNNSFRLHYVYFLKKDIVLFYDTFELKKGTKLEGVIDYFNVSTSHIDTTLGCMTPLNRCRKQKVFHVVLSDSSGLSESLDTSEPNVLVDLYFDNKQKLLAVYFHYNSVWP